MQDWIWRLRNPSAVARIVPVPPSAMVPIPTHCPPPLPHAPSIIPPSPPSLPLPALSRTALPLPRSSVFRGLLALLPSILPFHDASATSNAPLFFSLGFSGPKEWLKGQKKKTSEYLLAPILASRERLKTAISLAGTNTANNMLEAQNLVKVAARDCIKPEDGSIVAFQAKTGVEVCTFRLVLKNAASLLDDADPIKLNANTALDELISSFTMLNDSLSDGNSSSDILLNAFNQTNTALNNFETQIRKCIGIS